MDCGISLNIPDDGSDIGIKLGHQDTSSNNDDVQCQNMEETKEIHLYQCTCQLRSNKKLEESNIRLR